jgi:adenylate cyclase
MEADEEGTLARMKTLRKDVIDPKIAEYGGRIFKTTGDGILAEFPSAVDAVKHSVDVQRAMARLNADVPDDRRMAFRIGISLGDVIVDGDDLFGNGVNVAARMEGLADPGAICVSGNVQEHVGNSLDITMEDLGEQTVKNIARPVRCYRIHLESNGTTGAPIPISDKPAVAVLPFQNLSGDPEQEYFADGLTEDIITALSVWRSFPVIARNSTFAYKGQSPDIRRVGEELGARYVIEGSVRKGGERVRVTAQLIDAETGHHVWAEKYDREFQDIFALQDELTQKIAGTVAPALESAEHRQSMSKPPTNLNAWDCFLRGMSYIYEYTEEANEQAREMFERATGLEATYSRGFSGLAYSYYRAVWLWHSEPREELIANSLDTARRAVTLDGGDPFARFVLSRALNLAGHIDRAIAEAERGLELNPNDSLNRSSLGFCLASVGRPEQGVTEIEQAIQLNPRDPRIHIFFTLACYANLSAHRYEDAEVWARKAINARSDDLDAHLFLASILGHIGRNDEARAVLDDCARIQPGFTPNPRLMQFVTPADNEHFLDGLRKAGLPKETPATA